MTAEDAQAAAVGRIALQIKFSAMAIALNQGFWRKVEGSAAPGPPPNPRSGQLPTDVREQRIRAG